MSSNESTVNEDSKKILEELYDDESSDYDKTSKLLSKFRILTREKTLQPGTLDQRCIKSLVKYSSECQIEAQKCLSNLILNYAHVRDQLVDPYAECVEKRLTDILSEPQDVHQVIPTKTDEHNFSMNEVLYYDLRIIFLLSALCPGSRPKIRDRLADLILAITDTQADKFCKDNYLLIVESLKTLFNLSLDKCSNKALAGGVIKKLFALVGTEDDLSVGTNTLEHTDQLLVNLIHLLTNMPEEVYHQLNDEDADKILKHLDNKLKTYSSQNLRDLVLPVLNVCTNICNYKNDVRVKWFAEIVGSSKNFEKRPEEYDNLKGRLVKLMTSVDVHIKDIAADFLHALCDGDTEKFITYTGFGNSAAFLSSRGLLDNARRSSQQGTSSSDHEYKELRSRIDPITGKLDAPKKNPMEGMSEEEKEFHADELANAITKLTNLGVVKPMGVDQSGKLRELHPDCKK